MQRHQSPLNEFDCWSTNGAAHDPVGLVECEAAVGDRPEEFEGMTDPPLRARDASGRSLRPNSNHSNSSHPKTKKMNGSGRGQSRRSPLGINGSAPGALVDPFEPLPPGWVQGRDAMTAGMVLRVLRQFVVWRCRQLRYWKLWRVALLVAMTTGSAFLLQAVMRWKPAETFAEVGLRDECLAVTNGEGMVPEEKSKGVAQWVGKDRKELTKSLGAPYCQLPKTSVRSGAILDRSLYQLEDDRQMVVAFEGDRTIGYGIDPPAGGNIHGTGDRHDFELRQNWGWLPGSQVADRSVVGGLGSIALAMEGPVHAPMDGVVYEQAALVAEGQLSRLPASCAVFTSVQLPSYAVQLCGLRDRQVGAVKRGQVVGHSDRFLHFAVLRRDGTQWMFVPPSPEIVEQILASAA